MRLLNRARTVGFVVLALVTLYGVHEFATGDWNDVLAYWRTKVETIPSVLLLASVDLALEGTAWIWVYCSNPLYFASRSIWKKRSLKNGAISSFRFYLFERSRT